MGSFLADWLGAIWFVLASSGPYLLLGFVIAGLLKTLIPDRWIVRHIGGNDVRSVTIASLLGVPLPMCSCSVIPTATQLRRSGASKGSTTSFLISAPEIGVESVGVTWALMDPLMTILRPIAAFFTAFVSGVLVNGLVKHGRAGDEAPAAEPAAVACEAHGHDHGLDHGHDHGHDHAHDHAHTHVHDPAEGEGNVVRRAMRYSFGTLLDDLAPWFVLGFALAGLIVVLVPDDFFGAGTLLKGWPAMFAMLVAGVPLYICASATTPVAAALMAKGLDPGAALVLLLAGPATNIATILVVRSLLGRQVLAVYLASIAACSLALGALVNALYPFLGLDPTAMQVGAEDVQHGALATIAGAVVALLVLRSALRQRVDLRFARALGTVTRPLGFDPTSPAVRGAAVLALGAAYASTGLSVVRPGETGFLVRFGAVLDTIEGPGARWHAPWPFTRLETVAVGELRLRSYGFREDEGLNEDLGALDPVRARVEHERLAAEAEVLTRDEYILSIGYTVRYRVLDAKSWRFGHEDPDALVGALAEGALRSAAAKLSWREVLNDSTHALEALVVARLRERSSALALGCEVLAVDIRSAHAPGRVHTAFRDVASASEERVTTVNRTRQSIAIKRANAEDTALSTVRTAEADALRETARASGESGALRALGEVWAARPRATAAVLWLDQLERTLSARTGSGRTLLILLDKVLIDTYDRSRGGNVPTPPQDIFQAPTDRRER
ncbi:MAG: SO_0444 family Cu/Zn efflux transporter [Planctomycetota bacterium]